MQRGFLMVSPMLPTGSDKKAPWHTSKGARAGPARDSGTPTRPKHTGDARLMLFGRWTVG